jgi:hypothetical protein
VADLPAIGLDEVAGNRYELERFLLGGRFDLYEDGNIIGGVGEGRALAEISYGKLILSCWGDEWSRSWRVVGLDAIPHGLRLSCTRQMGRIHCRLVATRGEQAPEFATDRKQFAAKLRALIESTLTRLRVRSAVVARNDAKHLSGSYVRMIIEESGETLAGIAVGELELQATIDGVLTAGIIWIEELRATSAAIERLLVFAPASHCDTLAGRLTMVDPRSCRATLFEFEGKAGSIRATAAYDQGDLVDRQRRRSRAIWPRTGYIPSGAETQVESIRALAPDLIEAHSKGSWINLSLRGLEIARVSARSARVEFGFGESRRRLTAGNRRELEAWVRRVASARDPSFAGRDELLLRAQSERWLESMIRRHPTCIDPTLDRRYVYSQVPTYRGEQRTFIDLLAATNGGRLVVIELKVTEDPDLPFQGLDYWMRVEWHRARGDFQRRGYFAGLEISDQVPLLYLVAPVFRFHAAIKLVAGSISGGVPTYRIGINESWRSGIKVLLSEKLN